MSRETTAAIDQDMPYSNGAHIDFLKKIGGYEEIAVSDTTQEIGVDVAETRCTTSAAASVATLPAGDFPGQRKVIELDALGTAGDTLAVTPASGVTWKQANGTTDCASVTFDAAGEVLLVEWTGIKWVNIDTNATVA